QCGDPVAHLREVGRLVLDLSRCSGDEHAHASPADEKALLLEESDRGADHRDGDAVILHEARGGRDLVADGEPARRDVLTQESSQVLVARLADDLPGHLVILPHRVHNGRGGGGAIYLTGCILMLKELRYAYGGSTGMRPPDMQGAGTEMAEPRGYVAAVEDPAQPHYQVQQVAGWLGVTVSAVSRLISPGLLRARRVGRDRGGYRIPHSGWLAYLDASEVRPETKNGPRSA